MNEAITYDDVLLVPSYNHWESRKVVDISVQDRTEIGARQNRKAVFGPPPYDRQHGYDH